MRLIKIAAILVFSIITVACSTTPKQTNLAISDQFFVNDTEKKIGIKFSAPEQAKVHIYGADCLLCLATASAANSSLNTHAKSIDVSELTQVMDIIITQLKNNGKRVVVVEDTIEVNSLPKFKPHQQGFAKYDHRLLMEKLSVDYFLNVELNQVGYHRPYTNYIPTGAPVAFISGTIYMVNLETNAYTLYEKINLKIPAKGEWKEPPEYPGLTNSFFEATEKLKEKTTSIFPSSQDIEEK